MPAMPARPGLRQLLHALGHRRPVTRGVLRVHGLRGQVTVVRDRWGIPHIDASDEADAWHALGFCHGQDRGFQLEILLRAGRGTLAQLLGPAALPVDRLSRTLGFARLAAVQTPILDADVRAALSAYVTGIKAAQGAAPRRHELALLRTRATPWTSEDVIAFQCLQSLALSGNWDNELARLQILVTDGPDALRAVDPTYGGWLRACRRRGTSPTRGRRTGRSPAPRSWAARPSPAGTTASPPGASPRRAPTRPTCSGRSWTPRPPPYAGHAARNR